MKRVLTAAIALPVVVAVTAWGPDWLFTLAAAIVGAIALDEFLNISAPNPTDRTGRWFLLLGAATTAAVSQGADWAVAAIAISFLATMIATLAAPVSAARPRVMGATTGLIYTSVLAGFLILLPREAVLVLFGIVWSGDIGAYYGGRSLGRRRLAPGISPNKTVEGAAVGTVASLIVGVFLARLLMSEADVGHFLAFGLIALITAIAGQLGDLAESAIKRSAGVKDSSSLLPGHGGMLDRIDSLLFAGPVFYFLLLL